MFSQHMRVAINQPGIHDGASGRIVEVSGKEIWVQIDSESEALVFPAEQLLIIPSVHINGDTRENLQAPLHDAYVAVKRAIEAVQELRPNARNYYVQNPRAFSMAVGQQSNWEDSLRKIETELLTMYQGLDK